MQKDFDDLFRPARTPAREPQEVKAGPTMAEAATSPQGPEYRPAGGDLANSEARREAYQNRAEICRTLAIFGWLKATQIAHMIWPEMPYEKRNAKVRQYIHKMLNCDSPWLETRRLSSGGMAYVLTDRGASEVNNAFGIYVYSGARLLLPDVINGMLLREKKRKKEGKKTTPVGMHRFYCNEFILSQIDANPDLKYYTENQIQRGNGPWGTAKGPERGKFPDSLIISDKGFIWCEIENSKKGTPRLSEMAKWAARYLNTNGDGQQQMRLIDEVFMDKFLIVYVDDARLSGFARQLARVVQGNPGWDWKTILWKMRSVKMHTNSKREVIQVDQDLPLAECMLDGQTLAQIARIKDQQYEEETPGWLRVMVDGKAYYLQQEGWKQLAEFEGWETPEDAIRALMTGDVTHKDNQHIWSRTRPA